MPYSVIYVKTLYTWAWAYKCCFCLVYLGKVMQVLFLSCIHGQGHANPAFVLHTWARSCKSCFCLVYLDKVMQVLFLCCILGQGHASPVLPGLDLHLRGAVAVPLMLVFSRMLSDQTFAS